jgi:hypothetical protein
VTAPLPLAGSVPVLVRLAEGRWPEPGDPARPPAIAGFIASSFSPLVAAAAERCLRRAPDPVPARTAVVLVTATGDVAAAVQVARAVDAGARVGPLFFFQSVPNAVAGHVAARHGLTGPVICVAAPVSGDQLPVSGDGLPVSGDGLAAVELLFADGDADAAVVVSVDQQPDRAHAVLVAPATIHKGGSR